MIIIYLHKLYSFMGSDLIIIIFKQSYLWNLNKELPLRVTVDLGVMATKSYSLLFKASQMKFHHRKQFSVIRRTPVPHLWQSFFVK